MDRARKLLDGLDLRTASGIEIGALTTPLVRRGEGEILYVDHADTATLREKYALDPAVDVSRIVDVDAVWGANTLQQAVGEGRRFDYVLASHVVEHVPDLLGWLEEIAAVLRPDGTLRLAVPDRRYTFDFPRRESRLADILEAKLAKARAPLPAQVIDFVAEVVTLDVGAAWRGETGDGALARRFTVADAVAVAEDARRNGAYHDVHCWVFTPASFARLFGRAAAEGLHGFACAAFHDTAQLDMEFHVVLRPCADRAEAAASWAAMAGSVREGAPGPEQAELGRLRSEGERTRRLLAEAEAEAAALRRDAAASRLRVAALEASTSWRATGPLRAVARALRRG